MVTVSGAIVIFPALVRNTRIPHDVRRLIEPSRKALKLLKKIDLSTKGAPSTNTSKDLDNDTLKFNNGDVLTSIGIRRRLETWARL